MSVLGFKARVDPFACFLACVILRFTSGATLADCIEVSKIKVMFQFTANQFIQVFPKIDHSVRMCQNCIC